MTNILQSIVAVCFSHLQGAFHVLKLLWCSSGYGCLCWLASRLLPQCMSCPTSLPEEDRLGAGEDEGEDSFLK